MKYFEATVRLDPRQAREAIHAVLDVEGFRTDWVNPTTAYASSSSIFRLVFIGMFSRLDVTVTLDPQPDGLTVVRVEKERANPFAWLDFDTLWSRNSVFDRLVGSLQYALSQTGVLASDSVG